MSISRNILRIGPALLLALIMLVSSAKAEHSHEGYFPDGYVNAGSCLLCHKNKANEVMGTVHYLWRTENAQVEFPGGGAHGMIDRACGLVGSSAMINYGEECGRCHIGDTLPFPNPQTGQFTFEQKMNLDCLICHADAGQYDCNNDGVAQVGERAETRPRVKDPETGRMVWWQDRSRRAAESVGKRVSADACLRCHHHGQADYEYKRGTPYEHETDVHAAAGMQCTACHAVQQHKIARGNRVTDMFANELPQVDVKCENCHYSAPHANARLNAHLDRIGCETCHIPEVAGAQRRIWAPAFGMTEGPESQVPRQNATTGRWEPYSVYDSGPVSPSYRWFAGGASMLAEPVDQPGAFNMQPATRSTPGAKILPFRKFISGQPMDGRGIPGMPNFDPNFTMKAAIEQMAPAMKMMGMMRPDGMTPQEAAMMSQFPNMLYFDRAEYFATGNVADAVSIGMAKLGLLMQGQDPSSMSRAYLLQVGSQMWSGQIAGLDLPDNPYAPGYIQDQDPTTASGSFITVSHAVKKVGALNCNDCHRENGRLNFAALGYPPEMQRMLQSLGAAPDHSAKIGASYSGPQQCEECHEGKIAEVQGSVHYKFESSLPDNYQYDHDGNEVTFTRSGKMWKLCGFPTALPQFNWLGVLKDLPETPNVDKPGGCAQCHIGIGMKPFTAVGQTEPQAGEAQNVDCLICHATNYTRKYYVSKVNGQPELNPQGQPVVLTVPRADGVLDWSVYTDAAKSVGKTSYQTCLRCHQEAGSGKILADGHNFASFKRGSLYGPGADVHADAGMNCSSCHDAGGHRMKRPLNNDLSAHDQVVDHQMCLDCHGPAPHQNEAYNQHVARIACTTCHARTEGGAVNKDMSVAVAPDPSNPLGLYGVKIDIAQASPLEFAWFNGTVGPEIAPRGSREDGRIYPFKMTSFVQPMDKDNNPIPIQWAPFFKTGNMAGAVAAGRTQYAAMYNDTLAAAVGLAPVPGELDHYGAAQPVGFSISHGITKSQALNCRDCHVPQGRLDLNALGYSADRQVELESMFKSSAAVWALYDGEVWRLDVQR